MDDRLEMIFSRRSIRRYTGEPVSDGEIKSLLEAAMAAPSGSNQQPWHFVVVRDRHRLQALADAHPYGKMIARAEACIAVCGDPRISDWWVQDCSAVTENILVAAAGLGLGAVWIGSHGRPEREQALRAVLGVPKEIGVLSVIPIGRPGETKEARTQYNPARIHSEVW
jgi:nitroreductase